MVVMAPSPASADWYITPVIGAKFKGQTNIVDLERGANNTKLSIGVSTSILSDEIFGVEASVGYSPRFFERGGGGGLVARSNVATVMGSVIVAVPRRLTREALRPFGVAGLGLMHIGIADIASIFPVDTNLLGINAGGGAIGQLTGRTSLQFEVRHFRSVSGESSATAFGATKLSFWRATVGVSLNGRLF